jgi:hypothetical protein
MTAKLPEVSNAIRAAFRTKSAGDVVLRAAQPRVVLKAATFTVGSSESNTVFVTEGAINANLPAIRDIGSGFVATFVSTTANTLGLNSDSNDVFAGSGMTAASINNSGSALIGDRITVVSYRDPNDAQGDGSWYVVESNGTWADD